MRFEGENISEIQGRPYHLCLNTLNAISFPCIEKPIKDTWKKIPLYQIKAVFLSESDPNATSGFCGMDWYIIGHLLIYMVIVL